MCFEQGLFMLLSVCLGHIVRFKNLVIFFYIVLSAGISCGPEGQWQGASGAGHHWRCGSGG